MRIKYIDKKVKDMNPEELAASRKSIFLGLVKRNDEALTRIAESDKRNGGETK